MADDTTSELFRMLRDDVSGVRKDVFSAIKDLRTDFTSSIANLVTREAFENEIRHRDGEIARLDRDLEKERLLRSEQMKAEQTAREALEKDIETAADERKSSRRFNITVATGLAGTILLSVITLIGMLHQ